jgi:hypothetical protein
MPLRSRLIQLTSEGQRVLVGPDQIIWAKTWEGSVDFNKGKPATQVIFEGHRALTWIRAWTSFWLYVPA